MSHKYKPLKKPKSQLSVFDISKQLEYNLFIMLRQLKIEIQVVGCIMFSATIEDKGLCDLTSLRFII